MTRAGGGARLLLLAALAACDKPDPAPTPPKTVRQVSDSIVTGTVGLPVPGGITVQVIDYNDRGRADVKVAFTVTAGDGSISTHLAISDAEGMAHTDWTLGATAGENRVVATIYGIDSTALFVGTGTPDVPHAIAVSPKVLRIAATAASGSVAGRIVDKHGNPIAGAVAYSAKNTAVVTVSGEGQVTANQGNRGTSTLVYVTGSGLTDSAFVYNMAATDPPCIGIRDTVSLGVGGVLATSFFDNALCLEAASAEREYALVPFFQSAVPNAQAVFAVAGMNVKATSSSSLGAARIRGPSAIGRAATAGTAWHGRLRSAERRELAPRAEGARRWYSRRFGAAQRASRATVVPGVGDRMQLNVEPFEFCSSPVVRSARVVGVSQRAVVLVDETNPGGGLSDAEYAAYGADFDTLQYPVDVANFGAPTDIDENGGRILILFTHAVNDIGLGTLGFAYARDLLPKLGDLGACPGSNGAEIMYLRVPKGAVSQTDVRNETRATMAHELQHVINSARRLYVNQGAALAEETWLNEGLSHVAEELVFYRATGLTPRQNLGAPSTQHASLYRQFQFRNFERYFSFLRAPSFYGPIGVNALDDDAETRGAIWSFLRFAADQRPGADEAAFWYSLVNSDLTGLQNINQHVARDSVALIRDWAISNYLDGLVTTEARYDQKSWNLRQVPGFVVPVVCNLMQSCQNAAASGSATITLRAKSAEFIRFGVGANQEAVIGATGFPASANIPLPRNVLLAIVRTK